jgi:hypothetical protein
LAALFEKIENLLKESVESVEMERYHVEEIERSKGSEQEGGRYTGSHIEGDEMPK